MIIVTALTLLVEDLLDQHDIPAQLPSVAALRPPRCPHCGQPAHEPGKCLQIVGHGTYRRQVLGHPRRVSQAIVHVRRYLCRGCRRTIGILSHWLHPRRWYSADVILEALRLLVVEKRPEAEIRRRFCDGISGSWRTLWRWRREILDRLWGWLAKRLGSRGAAETRKEAHRRLVRLLAEGGELQPVAEEAGARAAPRLLEGTIHDRGQAGFFGRAPPRR